MDREERINDFLKDFFDKYYDDNKILFDNLKNIYSLISFLNNNLKRLEIDEPDFRKTAEATFIERKKLIDDFYKSIGVSFSFEDIIKNGTLEIIKTNMLCEAGNFELTYGNNCYEKGHKVINVYNNGLITDSIIWIHEISHYRNQPDKKRGQVNDLLTELLAFTEEFIYVDYLEEQGYKKESYAFKVSEYKNLCYFLEVAYYSVRIYLLYFLLGEVSEEYYKTLYGEVDSYDTSIDVFENLRKKDQDGIFITLYYSIGIMAIYNYQRYKEDNGYMENLNKLNTIINTDVSLEDALKIIDIKLDMDSLNKILNSINSFRSTLINDERKIILKR